MYYPKKLRTLSLLFVCSLFSSTSSFAQLPVCSGPGSGLVYLLSSGITNYDPSLPFSASNPSANTISAPGGSALAVSNNLNAAGPSPTFYSVVGTTFYYYNGTSWVNTGHNSPTVNIGGGGPYVFGLIGGTGQVYKYDGTTNASLVTTITGFQGPYDIVGDCGGNFYVMNTASAVMALQKYSSTGTLLFSWTISGIAAGSSGAGFAIIGSNVYYADFVGALGASTLVFSVNGGNLSGADYASCPLGGTGSLYSSPDTLKFCDSGSTMVHAMGGGPYTWSVLTGTATISGTGDSVTVHSTGNATILLSSSTSCAGTDTIPVIVHSSPGATITANNPICKGANLQFSLSSTSGASYSWTGPNSFSSSSQNPSVSNVQFTDSGKYVVTTSLSGCSSKDSIQVNVKPLPATPTASNNGPLCSGATLNLTSNTTTAGVSYAWTGPSFSSGNQNPSITNITAATAGTYKVKVSLNGCSDSITTIVTVNPSLGAPTITINVSPGDTICIGNNSFFSAFVSGAGSGPMYQWRKNGIDISGATNASYSTSGIANNDMILCKVKSNAPCQSIDSASSNSIKMHVVSYLPPTVSITSSPANYKPGVPMNFNATVSNYKCHSFQWRKNGINIPGATTSAYTTAALQAGDKITVFVNNCDACTFPDSAKSNVLTMTLGIKNVGNMESVEIWPNPVGEELIIETEISGTLLVFNLLGQVVHSGILENKRTVINTKDFPSGTYILQITNTDGNRLTRKIVKE